MGKSADITRETFAETFTVSPDVLDKLDVYERLLLHWQKGTNLVAPSTLDQVWHRHFADSAQLLHYADDWTTWVDLGSGAGFPGLVVAICAANREDRRVHLVESNTRKCAFLREVVRETGCSVEIHDSRIESLRGDARLTGVDIVSARALAPLQELFELAEPFFSPDTVGLFAKGRQAGEELEQAMRHWACGIETHPSLTDGAGQIVEVRALRRGTPRVEGDSR